MKKFLKTLVRLLLLQLVIGFLHLLLFNFGHPLNDFIADLPLAWQLLWTSIYGFAIYFLSGFLFMIALDRSKQGIPKMNQALLLLAVFFLAVFSGLFVHFIIYERPSVWLSYLLINPVFGTAFYQKITPRTLSFIWFVSAIIPSFGLALGMDLCHEWGLRD